MPSLDVSPKQMGAPGHGGGAHRRTGSRDYTVDSGHPLQHMQPNGRAIPTPPKTPDTKLSLKFASNMSRSISLGSSDRHNLTMSGTGAPQNGPVRPNLPGIASLHKPQPPSNYPYVASTTAAMVPPSSSTIASLSSSTSPAIRTARSTSSMDTFSSYSQHPTLNHVLPRPNLTRHESTGSSGRFVRGHEHHRSLDIDPFSALAELANLAEQHREMPGGGRPNNGGSTVVVQSKDDPEASSHHRRASYSGESMSRSGSGGSCPDLADVEDAVVKTMIERPLAPLVLGRRFSTLGHVMEEEHGEDGDDGHARHHSYHIEARKKARSPLGHTRSYSGHDFSSLSRELLASADYRPKRFSVDYTASTQSEPASEHDDEESMRMDEDSKGRNIPSHDKGVSPPSSNTSGPSAAYMAMRRGSVRELMAIDNLCLSSEEVERC